MQKKKFLLFIVFAVILGVVDQIAKELARAYLTAASDITVIPHFIRLTRLENKGISFGFMSTLSDDLRLLLFIVLPVLVILGVVIYIYMYFEHMSGKEIIGYCLIIGGAFGNLFDRIVYSSVTDFMHFLFFDRSLFVNNLADDYISIGLVFLIMPKNGTKKRKKK